MWRQIEGAWVHEGAELDEKVRLEPGAVIGDGVLLGSGTWVGSHAAVYGPTTIGLSNEIHAGAVLGGPPQDLSYRGEPTRLEIGDHNVFREFVTIHRATTKQDKVTRIGNHNYFMVGSHVGHDGVVEDHVILAGSAVLGGHCHIESYATLGGNAALHQFVRVGRFAFLSGHSASRRDLAPYIIYDQAPCKPRSINVVGLRRHGVSEESIGKLRKAFRIIFHGRHPRREDAYTEVKKIGLMDDPEVRYLVEYLRRTGSQAKGRSLELEREK